jgi:uncharacterized protein (DUF927 family)
VSEEEMQRRRDETRKDTEAKLETLIGEILAAATAENSAAAVREMALGSKMVDCLMDIAKLDEIEGTHAYAAFVERIVTAAGQFRRKDRVSVRDINKAVEKKKASCRQLALNALQQRGALTDYQMREDGLYYVGGTEEECISSRFEILGRLSGIEGDRHAKLIRVWKDDGTYRDTRVLHSKLQEEPSKVCGALADIGVDIKPNKQLHVVTYIALTNSDRKIISLEEGGWTELPDGDTAFVLGSVVLTKDGRNDVVMVCADAVPCKISGSFETWRDQVCKPAGEHHIFAACISMSFAAPLARPLGLIYPMAHGAGPSTKGKSTAALVAGSVYGCGDETSSDCFVRTWKGTVKSIVDLPLRYRDVFLVIDDTSARDPGIIPGDLVYQIASGRERSRLKQDGSARAVREYGGWMLTTGEDPMLKQMEAAGREVKGGATVRLFDFDAAPNGSLGSFDHAGDHGTRALAKHFRDAIREHYGHAGKDFVTRILETGLPEIEALAREAMESFLACVVPEGSDGQVARAINSLALAAVAGEFATLWGLTGWSRGTAYKACERLAKDWLQQRGGSMAAEEIQLIRRLNELVERVGRSSFVELKKSAVPNGVSYTIPETTSGFSQRPHDMLGYHVPDDREYWITPERFSKEIAKGVGAQKAAVQLYRAGMLTIEPAIAALIEEEGAGVLDKSDMRFTCRRRVEGRQQRFYIVSLVLDVEAAADRGEGAILSIEEQMAEGQASRDSEHATTGNGAGTGQAEGSPPRQGAWTMRELGYTVDQVVKMGGAIWRAVREQGIYEHDYARWRANRERGEAAGGDNATVEVLEAINRALATKGTPVVVNGSDYQVRAVRRATAMGEFQKNRTEDFATSRGIFMRGITELLCAGTIGQIEDEVQAWIWVPEIGSQ